MKQRTQEDRLLEYLRTHPGASSFEITVACQIVNVTGRISDLRGKGLRIEDRRDLRGVHRYYLVEEGQATLPWAALTWMRGQE